MGVERRGWQRDEEEMERRVGWGEGQIGSESWSYGRQAKERERESERERRRLI